jgi:hypothetical protein
MSDAFDKFERMIDEMSLRELHLAKQLLEVEFQRRVTAKESPSRIFWIRTFLEGINMKIKEIGNQERGNKP